MIPRTHLVLALVGLLLVDVCQPAPPLDYQDMSEDAAEEGGDKQALTAATTLLNVASLIPQVVRPLLNNISTGLTNALTATVMGRAIAFIPPETANPSRQLPQNIES